MKPAILCLIVLIAAGCVKVINPDDYIQLDLQYIRLDDDMETLHWKFLNCVDWENERNNKTELIFYPVNTSKPYDLSTFSCNDSKRFSDAYANKVLIFKIINVDDCDYYNRYKTEIKKDEINKKVLVSFVIQKDSAQYLGDNSYATIPAICSHKTNEQRIWIVVDYIEGYTYETEIIEMQ